MPRSVRIGTGKARKWTLSTGTDIRTWRRHAGTMLQEKGLWHSRLRRSQCAADTASDFRGFCYFEGWRIRLSCVPGKRLRGPRFGTAEAASRMSVWADALTRFTRHRKSHLHVGDGTLLLHQRRLEETRK